jgi:hypothetical protein
MTQSRPYHSSRDRFALVDQILEQYRQEGIIVPSTLPDCRSEYIKEHLRNLTPGERLEGLSPEEILQSLPQEAIESYWEGLKNGPSSPTA